MTWWKLEQPDVPPPQSVREIERLLIEAQGDITFLYDQLKRINDRLKQRASRSSREQPDDSGDRGNRDDGGLIQPVDHQAVGDETSSSLQVVSTSSPDTRRLSKQQLRELWQSRQRA